MTRSKRVLVTGCAQGIGRAIATEFAEGGWEVVGVDILPLTDYQLDVADPKQVMQLAERFDHLDCLVNNAAIQIEKGLLETTPEEWHRVISVNLYSAFYLTQAFAKKMKGGAIINISSVHARATSPGLSAYVASKGAISAFTRAAALELAPYGVRVNSILPGAIDTEMLQRGLGRAEDPAAACQQLIARTPLQRLGLPSEVAKLTLFLADPTLSGNITGQEFACDGGVLARLASE